MANAGRGCKSSPKLRLNLPDLDQAKSAVLNSLPSKEFQRGYRHAIDEFIRRYCSEPRLSFNKAVVTYRRPRGILAISNVFETRSTTGSGSSPTVDHVGDFPPSEPLPVSEGLVPRPA